MNEFEYNSERNNENPNGSETSLNDIISLSKVPKENTNAERSTGFTGSVGSMNSMESSISEDAKVLDSTLVVMRKQNKLLKIACVGLAACFLLTGSFGLYNITKKNVSDVFVSDGLRNSSISLTTVAGSDDALSVSEIYSQNIDSVVAITTEVVTTNIFGQRVAGAAAGSGFVISEDGYILTNYHVIDGASKINIAFKDGKTYNAEVVGSESDRDIAVLKITEDVVLKPVILGDSDKMTVGEPILAIGNSLGELTFSATSGIVSALDREISTDLYNGINMFQVDCAVNEGNSGGPIFNQYGEVIGIVSAKYASETIEGLGFCIPINDVSKILNDLIEFGSVQNKAYMGVSVDNVSIDMISRYNMVNGAYILSVEENSPAEKAGLKVGDIVVELNGDKVESANGLVSAKRDFKSGESATIKVWRSGEYVDMTITFGEEPKVVEDIEVENETSNNGSSNGGYNNYNNYKNYYNNGDSLPEIFDYFFGF